MCPTEYSRYYTRHLPHLQPEGATFFVTCRLAGTIPNHVRLALLEEAEHDLQSIDSLPDPVEQQREAYVRHRKAFVRWDAVLNSASVGPKWLRDASRPDGGGQPSPPSGHNLSLIAYCTMPNHVHIVFTPIAGPDGRYPTVTSILQSFKGYTAQC